VFLYFVLQKKEPSSVPQKSQNTGMIQKKDIVLPPFNESIISESVTNELDFKISFHERTWIQVYTDGEMVVNGEKKAGESMTIKALKEMLINLGNAGGISYTINGKEGKRIGRSGDVVKNMKITPQNYQQFLIQSKEANEAEEKDN
jgi:hypothetical protein